PRPPPPRPASLRLFSDYFPVDCIAAAHYNVHKEVYAMRTNVVIDDELINKAIVVSGLKTKKEVTERAIAEFVERHARKNISDLKGKICFADGYDYKAVREGISQ
ncbi:MAG: type II toxin-antitoxin system VapB family antitoxin, partial [Clostridiales bacterium]|nr:type II toxin-antitoxin system VapB family antitoxin [Clostridiales bacterium]